MVKKIQNLYDEIFCAYSDSSCYLDAHTQMAWAITVQVIIFNNPQFIMLLSLITVVIMRAKRRGRRLPRRIEPTSGGASSTKKPILPANSNNKNNILGSGNSHTQPPNGVVTSGSQNAQAVARRRESHAYTVLALLTVSAVVCWTPLDTFYTMELFVNTDGYTTFYQVAAILHAFQVVMDPCLFAPVPVRASGAR